MARAFIFTDFMSLMSVDGTSCRYIYILEGIAQACFASDPRLIYDYETSKATSFIFYTFCIKSR